jgi:hypothetical protein
MVRAGEQPVSGAQVTLYAAATQETALNTGANARNASELVVAMTDADGRFSIPYGYECPTPDAEMYLVSTGGGAGGGTNPNLGLMAALGPCSKVDASSVVVNEATTVAAVYALSGFMTDAQHVGSSSSIPSGMATAFATANDLVDIETGLPRTHTVSGKGTVPSAKVNALSNLLNSCARTAGSAEGDGSACDQFFRATNPGTSSSTQANNTVQALLDLARNATGFPNRPDSFVGLYQLAASSNVFAPAIESTPSDWTLVVRFPEGQPNSHAETAKATATSNTSVDAAGNLWVRGDGIAALEWIGGASYAGSGRASVPVAPGPRDVP